MINDWIKRLLGIDVLENRVKNLESEKADLEGKVIASEKDKEHFRSIVRGSLDNEELTTQAIEYLSSMNLTPSKQTSEILMKHLSATEIVEKYKFERYAPTLTQGIPSPVISIRDLRENPTLYIHKLTKGFLSFPIGLNFDGINKTLKGLASNISIYNTSSPSGFIKIDSYGTLGQDDEDPRSLVQITKLSRIDSLNLKYWSCIDGTDFLHNFDGLISYINENPEISLEKKKEATRALTFAKFAFVTAVETVGTTQIKDLSELLKYDSAEDYHLSSDEITDLTDFEQLRYNIKNSLLNEPSGTRHSDIEELLPIRSLKTFRELATEITSQIISNDKKRSGITEDINKPIEEYSIGEALVLACYFARHVITKYSTLEDNVKDLLLGKDNAKVSGKCTDYTGLALHYLREYLAPMQPEKFRNWIFGYDSDKIGDYKHCYMKLMHINKDQTVDVYFADPTNLASSTIRELKNTEEIAKLVEGLDLPLHITRDAEDLMYAANENMKHGLID